MLIGGHVFVRARRDLVGHTLERCLVMLRGNHARKPTNQDQIVGTSVDLGGHRPGLDEVADDGDVAGRVRHHGKELAAPGEPLPVDLDVEREDGQREGAPEQVVGRRRGAQEGRGLQEWASGRQDSRHVVYDNVVAPWWNSARTKRRRQRA
jgi:hypothetical protein